MATQRPPQGQSRPPASRSAAPGVTSGSRAPIHSPAATSPTGYAEPGSASRAPVSTEEDEGELAGAVVAGRYKVLKKLGEGGMGTVYLAEHVTIEKKVALKVLLHDYARKVDLKERFLQEARAAAKIGHENIVDITDFGDTPDGSVFFAMEFLEGIDLAQLIRKQGPVPWTRAKPILLQICRALSAAHSKGIIHRDMKPENIYLIEREGRSDFVKLLDFGIAKMSMESGESRLTRTGMIFGTPEYMSPEQAQGNKPDHRVDVYAVGVIMYEMLTGRVPFKADTFMGILTKHIFEQPVPPSQMNTEVVIPIEAERIVLKAMTKEREDRFHSMAEMAAAITSASGRMTRPTGDQSALDPRIVTPVSRPISIPTIDKEPVHQTSTGEILSDMRAARSRGPMIALIVLLVVAAAGAAIAVYLIGRQKDRAAAAGTGSGTVAAGTGSAVLAPRPADAAPAVAAPHEILVKSTPPGATIYKGHEKLGVTPAQLTFPRSDRKLLLTLKLDGHKEGTLTFTPSGGHSEEAVALVAEQPTPPTPPAVRPKTKIRKVEPKKLEPKKTETKKAEPKKVEPTPKKKTDSSGDLMNPFGD